MSFSSRQEGEVAGVDGDGSAMLPEGTASGTSDGVRRALLVTTAERYVNLVFSFASTLIVSRLLTPADFGVLGIGAATATLIVTAREFTTGLYFIQQKRLTRDDVRAAFTVMLLMNMGIVAVLVLLAPLLADFYGEKGLADFWRVAGIAIMLEVIAMPLTALMRRDMSFGKLAAVNIVSVAVLTALTIALAALGWSYMSFAWGSVAAALASGALAIYMRPELWVFQPLMRNWRGMLVFGGYNGLNVFLFRIYEVLPPMILGRVLSIEAAGLYNRTMLVCQMPDRVLLAGAIPVIMPALSAEVRAGRDLKEPYLRAVALITAFQWPALVVLALLAHPIVQVLLGSQWLQVVPLVQMVALASLFSFTAELNYPVLVSMGAMRDLLVRSLIAWPTSALIIGGASFFGLYAAVLSFFIIVPFQAYVSLYFVRRRIALGWRDLAGACWGSAVIAGCSAVGPIGIAIALGHGLDLPISAGLVAGLLAALGWVAGIWLTGHPLAREIQLTAGLVRHLGTAASR
jgi:O-antigen/teichoic acid export membrane protein